MNGWAKEHNSSTSMKVTESGSWHGMCILLRQLQSKGNTQFDILIASIINPTNYELIWTDN